MVLHFIQDEKAIILAISPANQDLQTPPRFLLREKLTQRDIGLSELLRSSISWIREPIAYKPAKPDSSGNSESVAGTEQNPKLATILFVANKRSNKAPSKEIICKLYNLQLIPINVDDR
jgi:hypothetical protein